MTRLPPERPAETSAAFLAARFREWQVQRFDLAECPVRGALDRVGDKWTALTLIALAAAPRSISARCAGRFPIFRSECSRKRCANWSVTG